MLTRPDYEKKGNEILKNKLRVQRKMENLILLISFSPSLIADKSHKRQFKQLFIH